MESGNVFLENGALLEFKSGQITTIADGTLTLDGAGSRVADAGKTGSNSALTGLTSCASGNLYLANGAKVATAGDLTTSDFNSGGGSVQLDGNNPGGSGGSSMTIGGRLINSSSNANGVSIGNAGITSADTLTVKGTGGLINGGTSFVDIEGSATV